VFIVVCSVGIILILYLIGVVIALVIWGLVAHGLLRLTGKTSGGIGRTYQAICYSSGANAVTAIPILGTYFGWIWWIISAVLMVKEGQKVHGGRATFAVLTLPGLSMLALVAFYIWTFMTVFTNAGSFAGTGYVSASARPTANRISAMQTVLNGVQQFALNHQGKGPQHAIQLVSKVGWMTPGLFLSGDSNTSLSDVTVGGVKLSRWLVLSTSEEKRAIQAAIDALPKGTIAHRLGDFVFTYHGIDLNQADPNLWVVILSPDPDVQANRPSQTPIIVGKANSTTEMIVSPQQFAAKLKQQNQMRVSNGLAPLPDPSTITHDKPALSPTEKN